jgi:iron complex outermembrane receptor protein
MKNELLLNFGGIAASLRFTGNLGLSFASVASAVLLNSSPAIAQADQPTAANAAGLEEIVVTARRREEKIQSVPLAVTAFTQADVEKKRIESVADLTRNVPSVSIFVAASDANAPFANSLALRGLPGSVIYFADVPLGSSTANPSGGTLHGLSQGFYYDLDNLEVINGPQGTLFGKNSIGGLISISPKRPTSDFEGYFKATGGNYGDREFEGAVNIPIVQDKLLVRIAGQSQQRDGYTENLENGKDLDNRNYFAWRVGVTLRPTDDFENYFLYDGYWQDTNGSSGILRYANPNFKFASIPLPGIANPVPLTLGTGLPLSALENPATAGATYLQLLQTAASGGHPSLAFFPTISSVLAEQQKLGARVQIGMSGQGIGKDYFEGYTDVATWNITDDLLIKNIAAIRIFKQLANIDFDGTGLPIEDYGVPGNSTQWGSNYGQYTEEFQLQGKAFDERLTWVAGGYFEYDAPVGDSENGNNALGTATYSDSNYVYRSRAAFVHGVYDLGDYLDGLKFTAGYRYTWDDVSEGQRATTGVNQVIRNAAGIGTNCSSLIGADANCFTQVEAHFSSYGWNLGLDEQLTPSTLIYVRSGNAYRPGGFNLGVPQQYQSFQPEHVTDVEVGEKSDFDLMGVHGRINAAYYHTEWKSIQVQEPIAYTLPTGQPQSGYAYLNAASATLDGIELQGNILPIKGLELDPHLSYEYAHYDRFPAGISDSPSPPLVVLPRLAWAISATYHLPIDESLGDLAVTASYAWNGHQYETNRKGEPAAIVPSYDRVDLNVSWNNFLQQPIDLSFFMTNALDKTYEVGAVTNYGQIGTSTLIYSEPRMFGFSVKYRFGGPDEEPPAEPAAYTPPPAVAPAPAVAKSYLVFFDFNKSDLTPQAQTIVDQAARNAGAEKVTRLTVTGHTDTVGSDAYNMRLSRRRAESVAAQLEKDGIPSSEIAIIAKGKRDLLVPTADGVREPQNRRVQIVYSDGAGS